MTETIDLKLKCNDCKYYDGYCSIYGLNAPDICNDFSMKDNLDSLKDSENDYI